MQSGYKRSMVYVYSLDDYETQSFTVSQGVGQRMSYYDSIGGAVIYCLFDMPFRVPTGMVVPPKGWHFRTHTCVDGLYGLGVAYGTTDCRIEPI